MIHPLPRILLNILLPDNYHAERTYLAYILFEEFLGLKIRLHFGHTHFSAEITLENGKLLRFKDSYFSSVSPESSHLEKKYLPDFVQWGSVILNPFLPENDLPILYGDNKLVISPSEITCDIDIFAATFFMLTRWEEYVLPDRDEHDRFPAAASLAGKAGFLHRPIINEYVEMLWNMLVHLGIQDKRKNRNFEFLLTHDVDTPLLWKSTRFFFKKLAGDLFKRSDLKEIGFSIKSYYQTYFGRQRDPYDSFDYLMKLADSHGLQSHFYFLSGGKTKYDNTLPLSSPFMQQLVSKIQANGHNIGIHPSYSTLKDIWQFKYEKEQLEASTGFPVRVGRQHFLRFEAPYTWQLWEDQGMTVDSTLYYPEQPGFRCGVCYPFPVFNFLTRKKLRLKEMPLTAMEVTWTTYLKASPTKILADMLQLKETVRKYNGTFVLLWHNSSFNTPEWKAYAQVYEQLLEKFSE